MAKRTIGKCRFYCCIGQYLKALGYYDGATSTAGELENPGNVWNMNPSQPTSGVQYAVSEAETDILSFEYKINNAGTELDNLLMNLTDLSSSGIYAGVLGHNIPDDNTIKLYYYDGSITYGSQDVTTEIKNYVTEMPVYNGYSLWDITGFSSEVSNINRVGFVIGSIDPATETIYVGGLTFGRWFEPSHSFDLKATTTTTYDGIKSQTTIGGSTLTNINHLGVPNWGNLPAWTLEKQAGHDYNIGGTKGRRQWKVSLSYVSDDNMFNKAGNENKFFTWTDPDNLDGTPEYVFDESMASFFKLTLNGKIPFIFCPDSSATDLEFALCKIDKDPSFKQVANNLFSTSLSITEVF